MRVVRPGGVLCLSVNEIWYEDRGFDKAFKALETDGHARILEIGRHPHMIDEGKTAFVGVFRKL